MNRIYKLVLVVEVSARSSFVLSMSVQINVITDINIFVQALRPRQDTRQTCSSEGAGSGEGQHPGRVDNVGRMGKPVPTGPKEWMRQTCVLSPPCDGGV